MKKEVEKTEVINDNSSQIGENEPLILSADNPEEPTQVGGKFVYNGLTITFSPTSLTVLHTRHTVLQ